MYFWKKGLLIEGDDFVHLCNKCSHSHVEMKKRTVNDKVVLLRVMREEQLLCGNVTMITQQLVHVRSELVGANLSLFRCQTEIVQ